MLSSRAKTAIISGATGGIGSVIAARLVAEGYRVFGTTTRPSGEYGHLDAAVAQEMVLSRCRAESWESVRAFGREVHSRAGAIQLLVVAHGAPPCTTPMAHLSPAQFRNLLDVDVTGAFHFCRVFGTKMAEQQGGHIALLTSMHALGTYPCRVPYSTAKTAIVGLGRALAVEWACANVQVNMIAPGQVDGPRTRGLADAAMIAAMQARTPAGHLVQAADIAETILWLTRTPSVTGQILTLDYGWTSSLWYGQH